MRPAPARRPNTFSLPVVVWATRGSAPAASPLVLHGTRGFFFLAPWATYRPYWPFWSYFHEIRCIFAYNLCFLQTRYRWKVDSNADPIVLVFLLDLAPYLFCRPLNSNVVIFTLEGISFDLVILFLSFLQHWKADSVLYIDLRSMLFFCLCMFNMLSFYNHQLL